LIALSGCAQGEIAQRVQAYDSIGARQVAERYIDLFGRENFFIELQNNLVYGDTRRNRGLAELARGLGLSTVATNNVHYHERARHRLQDVLVAVQNRTTLDASEHLRRKNAECYLKSPEEMTRLFPEFPEAVRNSVIIAERCQFDLTRDLTYEFPDFQAPSGYTVDEYLAKVCRDSARDLYGWAAPQIEERLSQELALVKQAGQAGFFLRNWQLMQYANEHNLPARGRGSSVGSLICYLLGLSGIDPLKYQLFVGRFLNESRKKEDVPDIDIDFSREAREKMFEHIFATYGTEHASLVANVISYRYPMAIRDVGKALGLPEAEVDKLAKRMRGRFAESLSEEMQALPEFHARMHTPLWHEFLRLVEELRGLPRHLGQHSGGVVISTTPIVEQVPVQPSAMDGRYICQWDKDSVADAGFIKMDLLGYPSLGHLYRSLKLIEERHGKRIDPARIPLDDDNVYGMIRRGDILGIVQIQSRAQLQAILRLEIKSIEDLVIQVALIRPGPIQGGAVNPYIMRCQGLAPITYDHPLLEPILKETKGVIIFQEQVLQVAMAVAGFSAGQAESLRRAMSRKRSRNEMEKLRTAFMEGCRENGLTAAVAEAIYEKVLAFAEFGFPKAHAAAMAETAAKLAWVKYYYPLEFYCSWLNEWPFGFYSPGVIVNEARRNRIRVLSVDTSKSMGACTIEGEAIRLGFHYVKGIGETTTRRLDELASEHIREQQPSSLQDTEGMQGIEGGYASLWDFWRRTRTKRETLEHLIRLGSFQWTGLHERELLWQLGLFYQPLNRQLPLELPFEGDQIALREMTHHERLAEDLMLTEGAIATRGHIMDLASLHEGITPSYVVDQLDEKTRVSVAGFVAVRQAPQTAKGFVFHTLEDRFGLINVISNPQIVRRYKRLIADAGALIVHGHIERQDRAVNVVAEHIEALPTGTSVPEQRTHNFG
jgi:error-prone DNA polymerase